MTDWITGIVALLGGIGGLGGICSIFLFYRENKHAKQLENEHTANAEWQELVQDYKSQVAELQKTVSEKDNKIDSQYKEMGELRTRNDKLSSTVAVLTITRCKVMDCPDRKPPMGSRSIPDPDEEQNSNKQE